MAVVLIPDAETMVVKFLLDDADISALAGANVATRLPTNPPFPFVVVQLISTSPIGGIEANVNEFWVQIDAYAGRNDFATASTLARTIQSVCFDLSNRVVIPSGSGETGLLYDARVRNFRRVPEPKTEWARYMLDVLFSAREGS